MVWFLITLVFLLLVFTFLYFLVLAGFAIFDFRLGAPFVPTKKETVGKMIKLAKIKAGDKVFDLGSGDGRLVIAAAKLGAEAVGIEKNPVLVLLSRIKIKLAKVQAQMIYADIFEQDLSSVNVIFLYLSPKLFGKLKPKLEKELKPGTKIISNRYPVPDWKPVRVFDNIFLYSARRSF